MVGEYIRDLAVLIKKYKNQIQTNIYLIIVVYLLVIIAKCQ